MVSLLVRLWVEMCKSSFHQCPYRSASLWGCELKCIFFYAYRWTDDGQPPCEAVSWNVAMSAIMAAILGQPPCEAVSWNKRWWKWCWCSICQPPCEAVSWNVQGRHCNWRWSVSLLVRLWVEIEIGENKLIPQGSQPPCEAVSWNNAGLEIEIGKESQPPCEAVSWNIPETPSWKQYRSQPPCEAVSWNDSIANGISSISKSASLWGCELKLRCLLHEKPFAGSASLWGCELKWPDHIRNTHPARQPPCEAVSWNAALLLIVYRP